MAPAMRCYRCQQVGHLAEGCNGPRRCLLCAGPHEHSVCTSAEKHCANCKGPHPANSLECPFIAKATAVEKLRANGRSYAQAVKEVEFSVQREALGLDVPSTHASYASIVADSSSPCCYRVSLAGETNSLSACGFRGNYKLYG